MKLLSTSINILQSTNIFSVLGLVIGVWVILSCLTMPLAPLGIWDIFDPFLPVQHAAERLGFTDDDGDTGLVVTILYFPIASLVAALLSFGYNRILRRDYAESRLTLLVSLLSFLPIALMMLVAVVSFIFSSTW